MQLAHQPTSGLFSSYFEPRELLHRIARLQCVDEALATQLARGVVSVLGTRV